MGFGVVGGYEGPQPLVTVAQECQLQNDRRLIEDEQKATSGKHPSETSNRFCLLEQAER